MKIYHQKFKELKLVVHRFSGKWNTSVYDSYISESIKYFNFEEIDKVITDLREISFEANEVFDGIKNILVIRKKIKSVHYKNVFLVADAITTAAAHLYKEGLSEISNKYDYCSTLESAIKFLELDVKVKELEKMMSSLKLFENKF